MPIVGLVLIALLCALGGFAAGVYVERFIGIPLWEGEDKWSIGIYTGPSPLKLSPPPGVRNPVLTAQSVTDIKARFVADPFLVKENGAWYMFFEVMEARTYKGKIGLASSRDGLRWKYEQIVLDEPYHLSYPYVFRWEDDYYMIPECHESNSVRLYKAERFPTQWALAGVLLDGDFSDASILRYGDRWWLFVDYEDRNDTLRLFYADQLLGPWTEHPESPIIEGDAHIARPGGRMILYNGQIVRYTQDDDPDYGNQLRAFFVTELTPVRYQEREIKENPVLKGSGSGWNAHGMHHTDPHRLAENQWLAAVDGYRKGVMFRLRY